jgi:hypothetical protein
VDQGGPVLASPRFVPVFFAGDLTTFTDKFEDFLVKLGPSRYWAATTAEYGVGPAVTLPAIHLAESAPPSIDDVDIQAWLASKVDGSDPAWPAPDDGTIYVLHYPGGTTITLALAGQSCSDFGGYHNWFALGPPQNKEVVYAVIPRCGSLYEATPFVSHELVEAVTDPVWGTRPAYDVLDDAHFYWGDYLGGSTEVGDLCHHLPYQVNLAADVPYPVQRTWSNASILASHDPCVPPLAGQVYFNAVPVLPDLVEVTTVSGSTFTVPAVKIPPGQTRTIDVDLFSDGDTGGPWQVDAQEVGDPMLQGLSLDVSLDAHEGQNGQTLHLTIRVPPTAPPGASSFVVTSTQGQQQHTWLGLVAD